MPFAGFYNETLYDRTTGGVLVSYANTSVTVKNTDGSDAVLYGTKVMTPSNVVANPTKTDDKGNLFFRAAPGEYDLIIHPSGSVPLPAHRVRTSLDPDDVFAYDPVPHIPGMWRQHKSMPALSNITPNLGRQLIMPLWVPRATPIDALGVFVAVAGAAGATIRLGLMRAPVDGWLPDTIMFESVDMASDVTGDKIAPFATTLEKNRVYWLASLSLVATCQPRGWAAAHFSGGGLATNLVNGFGSYYKDGQAALTTVLTATLHWCVDVRVRLA
jgi:hypothetical protein